MIFLYFKNIPSPQANIVIYFRCVKRTEKNRWNLLYFSAMNENVAKFGKKHFFIATLTILIFSVCDFLVAYFFQDVLKSPFFFDTIFMTAALFLFGPVASLAEYLLFISFTCIKLKIRDGKTDFVFLYTLSAFTIILVTWLFIRKKENLKKGVNLTFLYILTASVLAGLSCSVVSGLVNYFANDLFQKDWNFNTFIFAFNGEYMDFLPAAIIGRIPVTILDRVITTFSGFGISKLYSKIMYMGGGKERRQDAGFDSV